MALNTITFGATPDRLRRTAEKQLEQGRILPALELIHRCLAMESSEEDEYTAAKLLRLLHCPEQAMDRLYRQIALHGELPESWLELALCQLELDRIPGAKNSLYHLLEQEAEDNLMLTASSMLDSLEPERLHHSPERLAVLVQRAAEAFNAGNEALAARRFDRAARIDSRPARVWLAYSSLYLQKERYTEALRCTVKAWLCERKSPQPVIAMAFCLHMLGRKRSAVRLMEKLAARKMKPTTAQLYQNTLRTMNEPELLIRHIEKQREREPYRIASLHALADAFVQLDDTEKAAQLWQLILRIEPEDFRAALQLQYIGEEDLGASVIPRRALQAELLRLASATEAGSVDELLEGNGKGICDWCMAAADPKLHELALGILCRQDTPTVRRWLHIQLTRPELGEHAVNAVLEVLERFGDEGPHPILSGGCIASARIHPEQAALPLREKDLLSGVLRSQTDRHIPEGMAAQSVFAAHHLWQRMNERQRRCALYDESYAFQRAIVITLLRRNGRSREASQLLACQPYAKALTRKYLRQPMFHELLTADLSPNAGG